MPFDRRDERTHLFLVATLYAGNTSAAVRVRNLSPSGALVEAASLPPPGATVVLRRGLLEAAGRVAWSGQGRAGLSFDGSVMVSAWLPTKQGAGQAQADQVAFGMKQGSRSPASAPSVPAAPAAMTPQEAIADLVRLRAELDQLGDVLAQDMAVVAAHPEIQLFDAAGQRLAKIVEALRAQG